MKPRAKTPTPKRKVSSKPVAKPHNKRVKKQPVEEELSPDDNDDDDNNNDDDNDSNNNDDDDNDDEDEEALHMKQLQELAKSDPEFYESLQNEAKDLLTFGQEDEDEEENPEEESEEEEEPILGFSMDEIKQLEKKALQGDQVGIRKLIRIFRDAVLQPIDSLPNQEEHQIYDRLLKTSLVVIARGLDLVLKVTKQNPMPKPTAQLQHPIKQLLACLTKVIASKHTSPSVLQHVLQTSRLFCGYFTSVVPFEGKKFTSMLIAIWSREETEGPMRLLAFFRLRQMCLLDRELLAMVLRDCYVAFARNAKSFRVDAIKERIGLQARCLVELYAVDRDTGYRVAFLHIRQLALHVRSALANKTSESLLGICSWQFIHCLRLWGFILMKNDLNNLDFPLLQVALGVLSLFHGSNSSRYLPLQLHCLETINRLCDRKQVYAPVGLLCVELLSNLVSKKIIPCTDTMTVEELQSMLKFKAESAQHSNVRLVVIPAVLNVLRDHLKSHRTSVAFPELFAPIAKQLKFVHFDKKSNEAWKLQAVKAKDLLLRDGEEWSKLVREARLGNLPTVVSNPPTGPGDIEKCDQFRITLLAYYVKKDAITTAPELFQIKNKVNLVEPKLAKSSTPVLLKQEDGVEEEDEEEGVGALNPKDFL
ncbi:hypothetical protein BASA81_010792 [Batrachochytrium salamandrivorans]|nr:hypothetical protein BASA81_010792 [Batrachochytrium salamandrivorans]